MTLLRQGDRLKFALEHRSNEGGRMPGVEIRIPAVLRRHAGGARSAEVAAGSVREVLGELGRLYPELHEQLFSNDGDPHRFINIYVNDEDVRYRGGLDTAVREHDVISILPAIAGGQETEQETRTGSNTSQLQLVASCA